jgi:hypothetical protein
LVYWAHTLLAYWTPLSSLPCLALKVLVEDEVEAEES